jgi:hypothetical protein
MNRIFIPALCAVCLGSASVLGAQSGAPDVATTLRLNAIRAMPASGQPEIGLLNYQSTHPLFVSPYAQPGPLSVASIATMLRGSLASAVSQAQRPECPMSLSAPEKTNESMPVSRAPVQNSEPMRVAAPLCVNPLAPKR